MRVPTLTPHLRAQHHQHRETCCKIISRNLQNFLKIKNGRIFAKMLVSYRRLRMDSSSSQLRKDLRLCRKHVENTHILETSQHPGREGGFVQTRDRPSLECETLSSRRTLLSWSNHCLKTEQFHGFALWMVSTNPSQKHQKKYPLSVNVSIRWMTLVMLAGYRWYQSRWDTLFLFAESRSRNMVKGHEQMRYDNMWDACVNQPRNRPKGRYRACTLKARYREKSGSTCLTCLMHRNAKKSKNGPSTNQNSIMPEDLVVFSLLNLMMKNSSAWWKMLVESWKFPMPAALLCRLQLHQHRETCGTVGQHKTKYACIGEADESMRIRMEGSQSKYQEDHITGKGVVRGTESPRHAVNVQSAWQETSSQTNGGRTARKGEWSPRGTGMTVVTYPGMRPGNRQGENGQYSGEMGGQLTLDKTVGSRCVVTHPRHTPKTRATWLRGRNRLGHPPVVLLNVQSGLRKGKVNKRCGHLARL